MVYVVSIEHMMLVQEIYEAGAGYLEYQYRFQAAVVPGVDGMRRSVETVSRSVETGQWCRLAVRWSDWPGEKK